MAMISWNSVGNRTFETGVDRGVLYVGEFGVPWTGIKSIRETSSGGSITPLYLDGIKYKNVATATEYQATLEAFSSPYEFGVCDGTVQIHTGLFAADQPRKSFGLSYRTLIGNDTLELRYGYKLHLIYNAHATPNEVVNSSLSDISEAPSLSWSIVTRPPLTSGIKPTAHMIIDSTKTDPIILSEIEEILYGGVASDPRLPLPQELIDIFGS